MYKRFYFGEKLESQIDFDFDYTFTYQGKSLYFQGDLMVFGSIKIWWNGWIVPRSQYFEQYSAYNPGQLIAELISNGIRDWNTYIKGNFTLVVIEDHLLTIMTDPHGLSKVYYRVQGSEIEYSNQYSSLVKENEEENPLYPALIALFQHPVGGWMPHNFLRFIENPSFIYIRGNEGEVREYPLFFSKKGIGEVGISDLVAHFDLVVRQVKEYLNIDDALVTLTGGRDTRSVLAALLKNEIKVSAFTFGFPDGKDVKVSRDICSRLNIKFSNPYLQPLTSKTYEEWVVKLMSFKDPFVHLHRAHRLQAFSDMKGENPQSSFLFLGCMGGDYSKGIAFNDYIVTKFIRLYYSDTKNLKHWVTQILEEHQMSLESFQIEELIILIKELSFLEDSWTKSAEFKLAYHFVGTLHDVQDLLLARYCGFESYSPFMDIDFIEAQLQSDFNLYKEQRNSRSPFKRIGGGTLQAFIICSLYPRLGEIPLANLYKPKEILGNKFIYLIRRIYLQTMKVKDTPTFAYRDWFLEFVNRYLILSNNQHLKISALEQPPEQEGAWHKYTNRIWIYLLKNQYDARDIKE